MSSEPIPVACTLTPAAAIDQSLEWADLRQHATKVESVGGGARMVFPIDREAAIVDLVERESACCAFLDITTESSGEQLVVEVTSANPDASPIIALLAGLPAG